MRHTARISAGLVAAILLSVAPAAAGGELGGQADAIAWSPDFGPPSTETPPQGQGLAVLSAAGRLFASGEPRGVGGSSTKIDDVRFWDGAYWQSLYLNIRGRVLDLGVYDGELILGGDFNQVGRETAGNILQCSFKGQGAHVAHFQGGLNGPVRSMTFFEGRLIVAGDFTEAGGEPASHIAAWDGERWEALGAGLDSTVLALAVYDWKLYAGGAFAHAGGAPVVGVACWDGAEWSQVGGGVDGTVSALALYRGDMIAAGAFTTAGSTDSPGVAAWSGQAWRAIPCSERSSATHLAVVGDLLYAVRPAGDKRYAVMVWDGERAHFVDQPGSFSIRDLAAHDGRLFAAGRFDLSPRAGDTVVAWDGQSWEPVVTHALGLDGLVWDLAVFGDELIAAGTFRHAGSLEANRAAAWTGEGWRDLGTTFRLDVRCLEPYQGKLAVAGDWNEFGRAGRSGLAFWDGTTWSLPGGVGLRAEVYTLGRYGDYLVVGGDIDGIGDEEAEGVALWDGRTWHTLQTGVYGRVLSTTEYKGDLIVAGSFPTVGEESGWVKAENIARWDGQAWHPMGTLPSGRVNAVACYRGELYVGGGLPRTKGKPRSGLLRWEDGAWVVPGTGLDVTVRNLRVAGEKLLIFPTSGPLVEWDGETFQELPWTAEGWVAGYAEFKGDLYVGGSFRKVDDIPSLNFARMRGQGKAGK